ncbi:MAG: glucosaminidase domain-containing protein, partial [Gallionella sp.]|nr:glucosaminidase domain-containing protein [Gallionella sp.]
MDQAKVDFISSIADAAKTIASESGVSFELMLAQAALETGWGQKVLPDTNNIFNIKADSSWTGDSKTFQVPEYINGKWVTVDASFRVYPTVEDALRDRVQFLRENPRYADMFAPQNIGNLKKEATILQKAGYATDPAYAAKLQAVYDGRTMQTALRDNGLLPPSVCTPTDLDGNGIPDYIDDIKKKVKKASVTKSPIALDLNGDGITTTALIAGAYFDHDANGFAEQTGWVNPDDGILVRDLDGNGTIDTGRELFGSETILANGQKAANGYVALAELDTNHDGQIDVQDAAYSTLKIWKDIDGDGYS